MADLFNMSQWDRSDPKILHARCRRNPRYTTIIDEAIPLCKTTENHKTSTIVPPFRAMPTTLITLPRELRDEIYTYVALTSNFTFLLTCRQLNDEGTPLLYKHGTYRLRALAFRKERLPAPPTPPPASIIQNLYISMPRIHFGYHKGPNYEIPLRTVRRLGQFAGTELR